MRKAINMRNLLRPYKAPCLLPRRRRTLWGSHYMVRPALVKATFGNGRKLLGLSPIMHRPNYYLVWIDDRWDLHNGPEWIDLLDSVWDAIGEEFGTRRHRANGTGRYRWPEEDAPDGCYWWTATIEDVLTVHATASFRAAARRRRMGS